ncbi:MAG TPA: 2,3-bisphosphoglycerate-independent phosphoglycerate mutase [Bacteroidia bacterium]|nr:2,3-bisphosphoglycerate-independent phosphoglycerate mutase [Bacteroidia bacterium]
MSSPKVILIILDGWGHGGDTKANAIKAAHTPFVDSLYKKYPNAELLTSGLNVGLPDGQMGNSEVGHLNIGAGRVVYQDFARLNKAIEDKTFFSNKILLDTFDYVKKNNCKLHLMGLVSDGGVHSHIEHLKAICTAADDNGIKNVFIHAFTDGRDTDPRGGIKYISELEEHLKKTSARIASVTGRYYAMDRDKRWERIKLAYNLLVNSDGEKISSAAEGIRKSYNTGVTDEFIKPLVITDANGNALAKISDSDAVLCFNFRTDRCREITKVLTQSDMPEFGMKTLKLHYVTMTNYDDTFHDVKVMYENQDLKMTLGEVLALNNKTQLRISETEKYPHVTFFFSGGREEVFDGEKRILIPSPKVATYDLQPEMSAVEVTDALVKVISPNSELPSPDFICLNYANADMVGHTGVFSAAVKAVETVDSSLSRVVEAGLKNNYSFLITSDHGNADYLINDDGSPNTAHTTNPVPVFLIDKNYLSIKTGRLCDLAPTILKLMEIKIPEQMTGSVLV